MPCSAQFLASIFFISGALSARYMGCYLDPNPSKRLMPDHKKNFEGTLTNGVCIRHCTQKGFRYAGTQWRIECFCSNERPPYLSIAGESECNLNCAGDDSQKCGGTHRISVFDLHGVTEDLVQDYKIGCFKDAKDRLLPDFRQDHNFMTPELCLGICYRKGYPFAGVEYGKECYCGDSLDDARPLDEAHCKTPCGGIAEIRCGGVWHLSVYSTGITDLPLPDEYYVGCFQDSNTRIFKAPKKDLGDSNSPTRCMNICRNEGFKYSGTQYGVECFCGNNRPAGNVRKDDSECNTPCPGNSQIYCGGLWRLLVFSTGIEDGYVSETPVYLTPSPPPRTTRRPPTTGHRPQTTKKPSTPGSCHLSQTTVLGKRVCKGHLVFNDQFNSKKVNGNKWTYDIFMPWTPDYEFVVFNNKPQNIFISENRLHIKPTLRDEKQVLQGVLDLKACTGRQYSGECKREAASFNILPPVESARINTRDTFTFRYGVVEVRAKLPAGDWIIPELWLEPARRFYGADYASGRIRLAMARGNKWLSSGDDDLGIGRLECGLLMGVREDIRQRSVIRNNDDGWHSDFHNYTLIWTPDNLSFLVDGQLKEELIPPGGGRMCDLMGFTGDTAETWRAGLPIAPCDKEFHLSLGVSVGGIRDFPDNVRNGAATKPWRNTEVKAMVKFWKARHDWTSTWDDIDSAMQVDFIKVRAL